MSEHENNSDVESLYSLYPSYLEALELFGTDSYDARERIRTILDDVLKRLQASTTPNMFWISLVTSSIGCALIDSDNVNNGVQILIECIKALEQQPQQACLQLLQSFNTLAVVMFQKGETDTATKYLEKAETLFQEASLEGHPVPTRKLLDRCHTQTVFLLAQVYSQSSESTKAALYCHKTLQRQIINAQTSNSDFDAFDWALNCIKLSAFYVSNKRLRQASYCIHAAMASLPEGQSDRHVFAKADIDCALAEIYGRCLQWSANLYQNDNRPLPVSEAHQIDNTVEVFTSMTVPVPSSFTLARNLKDAQTLFREGYRHYQAAMNVYTLDGFVTDHVAIVQKCSQLLKDLSIFSCDHSYICKLCKRRIDLLEPVLLKLNPKIYSEFTRELRQEIAQTYSEMADHKAAQKNEGPDQDRARSKKINNLTRKSIQYFNDFIESLRDQVLIDAKDVNNVRDFLKAKFQIARLHSRFVHYEVESQIVSLKSSLRVYEEIVKFCSQRPASDLDDEMNMSKEMCSLLPLKIQSRYDTDPISISTP